MQAPLVLWTALLLTVGLEYRRFAYEPKYHFAERLTRFVMEGMKTNEDAREAKTLLLSWDTTRTVSWGMEADK